MQRWLAALSVTAVLLVAGAVALLALSASSAAAASGSLLAPAAVCPGQTKLEASPAAQERSMLCMVNFAREQLGLATLAAEPTLETSAREKTRDILRCDEFSHYACGREFAYWIRASGYLSTECWRAGENLAWGSGALGGVRSIFRAWLRSPEHRENILGEYSQTGIDLVAGTLEGLPGTRVWTEHFGSHC